MGKIVDVLFAPGLGAFFYDDQAAIRSGAHSDGFLYTGVPITEGFNAIRMPARSLGLGLVLADSTVVWGDMMSVQYAGGSGRDSVFDPDAVRDLVERLIKPRLLGADVTNFRQSCAEVLRTDEGATIPLAVQYGVSQAMLRASAHVRGMTMAEIVCAEFGLPVIARAIPLYAQSGDAREINVDKMILKRVDILPHGLINSKEKFGQGGARFLEFLEWVAKRVSAVGGDAYRPTLHFDVYGWVGHEFGLNPNDIADFIARAAHIARPFCFNVECPADFGSRARQIDGYSRIRSALDRLGSDARIVADEWCNTLADIEAFAQAKAAHFIQIKMPDVGSVTDTIAAVLACRAHGVGAYVGGSCAETDLTAQVSTHIAIATQADMLLVKPGMGVDEGLTIVGNEQSRLLAMLEHRSTRIAQSRFPHAPAFMPSAAAFRSMEDSNA